MEAPHRLIEGRDLVAYGIHVSRGYIVISEDHPQAVLFCNLVITNAFTLGY